MYASISESDFRKKVKDGLYGEPSVFLFYGEEDYLKHNAVNVTKDTVLTPDSLSFDYVGIGSAEYSADALAAALASPPMFGERKVISVNVSISELRPSEVTDLEDTLSTVDISNIVLINVPDGGIDPGYAGKPSAILKKLSEYAMPVYFERVAGPRLAAWAEKHYKANGLSAEKDVCMFTVDYCGSDMFTLASEIDKISYFALAHGAQSVTRGDVVSAGCHTVEFDTFALANAVAAGQYKKALEVLGYLKAQKTEPTKVMADIIRVICDLSAVSTALRSGMTRQQISDATGIKPYPLGRYIQALESIDEKSLKRALMLARTADEGVKGYAKDYVPIEQLICSM